MHITMLPQKVRCLGGKGIDLHPWGSKIKFRKWHGLCSMMIVVVTCALLKRKQLFPFFQVEIDLVKMKKLDKKK